MGTSRVVRITLAAATVIAFCEPPLSSLSAQQPAPATVRRVITGNDSAGKSYIVSDERIPQSGPSPGMFRTTPEEPLGKGAGGDARLLPIEKANLEPGIGGSLMTLMWVAPATPA